MTGMQPSLWAYIMSFSNIINRKKTNENKQLLLQCVHQLRFRHKAISHKLWRRPRRSLIVPKQSAWFRPNDASWTVAQRQTSVSRHQLLSEERDSWIFSSQRIKLCHSCSVALNGLSPPIGIHKLSVLDRTPPLSHRNPTGSCDLESR